MGSRLEFCGIPRPSIDETVRAMTEAKTFPIFGSGVMRPTLIWGCATEMPGQS